MARPVVLSNGELHVGINKYGEVHDFYYPYVGLENHAAGKNLRHHVGVWVDGRISWLDDGNWNFDFSYPHESLVGHTVAQNAELEISLEFDDVVDAELSALLRNIHVVNMSAQQRDIRLFMHQAFDVGDARSNTDTAQYLPDANAVLHYRGRRAMIISGKIDNGKFFDQYTVGLFGIEGREGTYKDAEDGELSMCSVEHGKVDSTLRFKLDIESNSSARVHYWVACGTSTREALYIHKQIQQHGVNRRLEVTNKWWHEWLKPAMTIADKIDGSHRAQFLRSCMLIKSHIDKRGAVIASTDSSMLNYSRDAYAYCWPRDGAYVLWPLIRMGYKEEPYKFFEFCRRALHPGGFLMHKYRADGALGSSWHPYIHENGVVAPPIQEDETALTLFVFSQFYNANQSESLLKEFYEPMVVPMANFMAQYTDKRTGLPRATYDLWEEQYMTTTYTTAVTYASLLAAADLADVRQDEENAVKWRACAEDIKVASEHYLYNNERQVFYKGIRVNKNGEIEPDETIDMSAVFGAFMFGLFNPDSHQINSSFATAKQVFGYSHELPGIPRYENDNYHRRGDDAKPNWWFVSTLWAAQYYLEVGDSEFAKSMLDWTRDKAWATGVLSEQIDPATGEEVSVSPLCWSQAEYVATLIDMVSGGQNGNS